MTPELAQKTLLSAPLPTVCAVAEVAAERQRQEEYMLSGRFNFTGASRTVDDLAKLPILGEEYGEVCKELNDRGPGYRRRLRAELIQLAAVATAWAEALPTQ